MVVCTHNNGLLPLLHFHRNKLFFHAARFVRRVCRLLAAQRVSVGVFARNSVLLGQFLRRQRHRRAAIGVRQTHHQRIFQRAAAKLQTVTQPANHKRRLRHVLHAAGQHHVRFTKQQPLRRLRDRFNPRAAQPVHRHCGRFDFQPSFQAHVPRAINRVAARLHHVAKNHVIEIPRVHTRAPNRFFRSVRRQINRAHVRKRADIARHWRPRSRHNHYICRKHTCLALSQLTVSSLQLKVKKMKSVRATASEESWSNRPLVNFIRLLTFTVLGLPARKCCRRPSFWLLRWKILRD